jgi:hypothetical protein
MQPGTQESLSTDSLLFCHEAQEQQLLGSYWRSFDL